MRFVPSASLVPGMIMGRDIISNNSAAFMLKKGVALTDKAIDYIRTMGYVGAYITDNASADVELEEIVDQQLIRQGIEAVEKENVGSIIGVATDIVSQISAKKDVSVDLFDLRSYDDYTYHHSVNVGVFAVAVGRRMGLKEEELKQLSLAGICHDLGKSRIDKNIINKPERLTDEEFKEVKNHPKHSFSILSDNVGVSSLVRQAVLYHHENENGSGYPYGKEGKEIPIFAKIIHAVDVYDALTSKRPYKDPYAPVDAFNYLDSGKDILFDAKVVDVMHEVIPSYPPGIEVVLSNDETALVISHTNNAFRPKIKISTGEIINLEEDEKYKDITIVKSGIMPVDYVGDIDLLNEDRQAVKEIKVKEHTIVIVDDSMLNLKMAADILNADYNVVMLQSGMDAIKYFSDANNHADLLISDVEMPVMNGIATVRHLKKKSDFNVPVIFMTAAADKETIFRCREVGAIDYILKPINPDYVKQRVKMALYNSPDV